MINMITSRLAHMHHPCIIYVIISSLHNVLAIMHSFYVPSLHAYVRAGSGCQVAPEATPFRAGPIEVQGSSFCFNVTRTGCDRAALQSCSRCCDMDMAKFEIRSSPACRGTQLTCSVDGIPCKYTPFFQPAHDKTPDTQVLKFTRLGVCAACMDSMDSMDGCM